MSPKLKHASDFKPLEKNTFDTSADTHRIYIQTSYSVNEIIYNIKGPYILQLHTGIYLEKYKCSKSNYIYGKMFFKEVLLYLFDQKYSDFFFFFLYII